MKEEIDLFELMTCKNCKYFKDGTCTEKSVPFHLYKVKPDSTCSSWEEDTEKEEREKKELNLIYNKIIEVLKYYSDLRNEYYPIIAIWIIGTYYHDNFPTYPYIFFVAMRGSGKSRILNLISNLSFNGKLVSNVSEAVLFRTAKNRTLCIDEFEEVDSKDKASLRELLNSAYKKGMCVERAIRKKGLGGEKYEIESFDVYCAVAMANINGVEDVLSDRCITLILEKSTNKKITRLIELFDQDDRILDIKNRFKALNSVGSDGCDGKKVLIKWNEYAKRTDTSNTTDTTDTTYITNTTNTTNTTNINQENNINKNENLTFFDKILNTSLEGRNLELFFPLFFLAEKCNVLDEIIPIAEKIVEEKKKDDFVESRDVSFLNFLSQRNSTNLFVSLKTLVREFSEIEEDAEWVNTEWVGKALKRLGLVVEKKRKSTGREVIIDYQKVKEKVKIFT